MAIQQKEKSMGKCEVSKKMAVPLKKGGYTEATLTVVTEDGRLNHPDNWDLLSDNQRRYIRFGKKACLIVTCDNAKVVTTCDLSRKNAEKALTDATKDRTWFKRLCTEHELLDPDDIPLPPEVALALSGEEVVLEPARPVVPVKPKVEKEDKVFFKTPQEIARALWEL